MGHILKPFEIMLGDLDPVGHVVGSHLYSESRIGSQIGFGLYSLRQHKSRLERDTRRPTSQRFIWSLCEYRSNSHN